MTLTIEIPKELEQRLKMEAQQRGISVADYALQLLRNAAVQSDQRTKLSTLIHEWIEQGDEGEQRETGTFLIEALDADRMSDRKLFPAESRGITW